MTPEEIKRRLHRDGRIVMYKAIFFVGGLVVLTFWPPI